MAQDINWDENQGESGDKINQDEFLIDAKNFFNNNRKEIGESVKEGKKIIQVGFDPLSEHSPKLAESLIAKPEETLALLELALVESGLMQDVRVRFNSIAKTQEIKIRNIRAQHLNNMISIEGIVRQASEVRPQVVNAKFECPSCGTIISVLQLDKKFKEPSRCSCGRRGGFKELAKDMVDAQRIVLEESPENMTGGEQPKRMQIFLKEDLVEPKMEEKTTPGARVKVIGVLKEISMPAPTGGQLTRYDLAIEANNIIPMEESFDDLIISDEDERAIKELAADPKVFEKLAKSIAPSIWGYAEVKSALALQLFGGVKKTRSDGTKTRGDIHCLLVGDPGVAKSVMLKFISSIAPKGRYVSGKSASGAGLTATVVKDEFMRGWALEAGAMVLSNKGLVCLHPDSSVIFNDKISPISQLFDNKNYKEFVSNGEKIEVSEINGNIQSLMGDNLQFGNQNATLIRRKMYNGKLRTINLDSGFSITLTPDHQLVDGNSLKWKESQNFKENDFVLAPLKLNELNKNVYILDTLPDNWIVCLNKSEKQELKELILQKSTLKECNTKYNIDSNYLSGGKQLKISTFKQILKDLGVYDSWKKRTLKYGRSKAGELLKISEITPELAYFIGFVLGDGNIKSTKRHSLIQITQSTKNIKQINKIKENFEKFSHRKLGEYKRKSHSFIRGKEVNSEHVILYSGSNLLSHIVEFYTNNKLRDILNMPQECLKAFIAGCMDSDGCISIKNYKKNDKNYSINHIEFLLSNDAELNKNFVLAIRRLDCYAKFVEDKPINIIRLTGSLDVETLVKEISNYSVKCKELPKRKELISSASSKIPLEIVSDLCDGIIKNCVAKQELNDLGISSVLYDYKNKTRQPSREQLIKIGEKLNLPEEIKNKIEILVRRDYFIDKINSIKEENYSGYVYDLFVPDTHNFICNGIVVHNCIDELEKMDENDRSTMHEAMEQQTVTISKANVQASLKSETSVLAAANPKFGRFDPTEMIAKQVNLGAPLLNRFDVIFILRDLPSKERDESIASHVLHEHKQDVKYDIIEKSLLRKYIAYARQRYNPTLSDEAMDEIKTFYVSLRNQPGVNDMAMKPIPISARQLEALVRLAEGTARSRLSKVVTRADAIRAIELMKYYLMGVGYDYETKTFDIDKISGNPASARNKLHIIKEELEKLESRLGKLIPMEEVEKIMKEKMSLIDLEENIDKLVRAGDLFRPRKGYIQRM